MKLFSPVFLLVLLLMVCTCASPAVAVLIRHCPRRRQCDLYSTSKSIQQSPVEGIRFTPLGKCHTTARAGFTKTVQWAGGCCEFYQLGGCQGTRVIAAKGTTKVGWKAGGRVRGMKVASWVCMWDCSGSPGSPE